MLQAQDLVLGFARFLGAALLLPGAAGVSTAVLGGLASKKKQRFSRTWVASSTTITEKGASGNVPQVELKALRALQSAKKRSRPAARSQALRSDAAYPYMSD